MPLSFSLNDWIIHDLKVKKQKQQKTHPKNNNKHFLTEIIAM